MAQHTPDKLTKFLILKMGMEHKHGQMVLVTLVNGVRVKLKVRELSFMQMAMFFKEVFLKTKQMVKEPTLINLGNVMRVNG